MNLNRECKQTSTGSINFAGIMLTEEEKRFIRYWEETRLRKKRGLWQLAAGLPLGVAMGGAILLNIYSDWFKGASAALKMNSDRALVILAGILLLIIFMVVFSARHKWEINEQRYRELLHREKN